MLLVNKNIALKFNTNSHSAYGAKLSLLKTVPEPSFFLDYEDIYFSLVYSEIVHISLDSLTHKIK